MSKKNREKSTAPQPRADHVEHGPETPNYALLNEQLRKKRSRTATSQPNENPQESAGT